MRAMLFLSLGLALTGCPDPAECESHHKTLSQLKHDVFAISCASSDSCHNANGHMGSLNLVTDPYGALMMSSANIFASGAGFEKRVVPGDETTSFLYVKVTLPEAGDPKLGSKMPN